MLREEIRIGEKYQCRISGQIVTCRVVRKGTFRALVTFESRWGYTGPSSTAYRKVSYRKFLEEW